MFKKFFLDTYPIYYVLTMLFKPLKIFHLPNNIYIHIRSSTQGGRAQRDLTWPGRKQTDIPMEVDTARLTTCRFKNGFAKCVLLYCPSSEFESTFMENWQGEGAAGLSCTKLSIWEIPFLRGGCRQWGIVYDIVWMGCPRRTPWKCYVHLYAVVSYRRLSPQFQFFCLLLL